MIRNSKIMKPTNLLKQITLLIFFVSAFTVQGQIPLDVSVNVFPPYPSKYNIWVANSSNYMITVVNNSDTEFEYYIRASVEGVNANAGTYVRISEGYFPSTSKTIGPFQVEVITSDDLQDLYGDASVNDLELSPDLPFDIDGELPEGEYQLCFEVMLYDPLKEVFLSPKLCSEIFSISHGNIQLNYPLDEMVWDLTDVPVPFQWSNISSTIPTKDYEYVLRLYELDPLMLGQESIFEYIQSGAAPFYITEPLMDLSYVYDVEFGLPEFIPGNLYAAQVEVIDLDGSAWFDNQNLSNINTFWFGFNPFLDDGSSEIPMDCFERCQLTPPANSTPINKYNEVSFFKMGHFTVDDLMPDSQLSGSTFAGTGYITLDFLNNIKIAVQFSGVTLNTEYQALSGSLKGIVQPTAQNIVDDIGNALSSYIPLDPDVLGTLSDICNDLETIEQIVNGRPVGLPFGFGQEVGEQAFTLAIVDFEANVNGANMNIVNILDLTQLGPNFRLGLGAAEVCVAPDGFGNEFKIHLLEDAFLPLDGGLDLNFKGGEVLTNANYDIRNNQSPCYIEMACEGVKAICISGTAIFPNEMLRKEVDGEIVEGESVKAYFSSIYERDFSDRTLTGEVIPKTDFIMDFVMDDFQLNKLPGYSFKLREGSLDLSDIRNPSELVFPEGYEHDYVVNELWQGFYLKTIEVLPPKSYTSGEERSSATIHHVIIDPALSMDVEAYHLLPFERGSFKGWGLGIDTFQLKILQNTLQHGHLDGKFGAPVFQEDAYLDFHAIIDEVNAGQDSYYTFNARVEPSEDLQIPIALAHATVCQNSYLAARFSKESDEEQVEVFLKGDLDVNTGSIGETISGNAHIRLADYQVHYNSVDGFVMPEELNDGRGSYFGANDNEAIDCSNLDYTSLQDAMDYMMARMIENGENMFRTVANEIDDDMTASSNDTWRDGDEMNGLPIRFRKSNLNVNAGNPELSLILEAQLNPQAIIEAGLIISSEVAMENNKFHFNIDSVEFYISEGMIVLNEPIHESAMATNEAMTVKWSANFSDEVLKDRLVYDVMVLTLENPDQLSSMDSLFRNTEDFVLHNDGITGSEVTIALENLSGVFTVGSSYAIRLKASDPEGEVLNNDGYSNINVFTWGQTAIVGTNAGNNSECAERCSPELPENTTYHSSPTSVESFNIGNFTVEVDGPVQQSGQLISGNGVVTLDFLNSVRLDVAFLDVALNTDGQAFQGVVNGKKTNPSLISQVGNYIAGSANSDVLEVLNQFLDETRMVTTIMNSGKIDLPFGLNVSVQSGSDEEVTNSLQIAFTDFNLTPTTSDVDFIYLMSLPNLGSGFHFGLGAQDICIAPEGFGNEARLYLTNDLDIPMDGEAELKFNGGIQPIASGTDTLQPFYLEIDCNGFKAMNISGSATFPQDMIVKEDISTGEVLTNEAVKGYFSMLLEVSGGDAYSSEPGNSGTNLLLSYTMDPFQIKGLPGWGFELEQGVLDLSETSNLPSMIFPTNYDMGDLPDPEFWTGFYLKQVKFKPPGNYTDSEDPGDRVFFTIENLLIDPQFSAVFTAQNLLSYENGNIKGWGMSIDSFGLNILQNTLISGGMKGQIGSPVLAAEDFLIYEAVLDKKPSANVPSDSIMMFSAIVRPQQNIHFPILAAQAEICASSYLGFQLGTGDDNTHLELFLKGNVSIDLGNASSIIPGDFTIGAAELQLKYNTVKGFVMESEVGDGTGSAIGLGLSTGEVCANELYMPDFDQLADDYQNQGGADLDRTVAGAGLEESDGSNNEESGSDSPTDCAMNGFPVRLGGFDLSLQNGLPSFSFTVDLALASGGQGFAAGAGLTIHTEQTENNGKSSIGIKNVEFDCARLAVDLDFLELLGCLCQENEIAEDGSTKRGYFGRVVIKAMDQIFVDLQGGFATYRMPNALEYGTDDYHGYWYIDGTFASNSGIPLGPVRLNAFGGGVYWNMDPPPLPGHDELNGVSPGGGAAAEANACIEDLATKYDIQIPNGGAPLAAAPYHDADETYGKRAIKLNAGLSFSDPALVILDPLVKVEWTANEGIDEITVGGYLYLLQEDYMSRGAPAQPPTSMAGESDLEFSSKSSGGGVGSRMWIAAFNSLYFDRESADKTLVAFRGTGSFYANILPNLLYGSASPNDPYRVISHDIFIGHVDHAISRANGYSTGGDGLTYWHAYFGNPYDPVMGPGSISFDLAGAIGGSTGGSTPGEAGITATMYAMMGHGLPRELPPIPDMILDIINEGSEAADGDNSGSFDGEPVDENAAREELSETTSGFAFGSTVEINVGFEKIIYATLEVVLGMDLLFQNTANTQCEANGTLYSPPGVANFYGMGQAFAGMRGDVGVRGKILGKEVDVKFLSLAAAMMIQAGGPNPFWIDGRAAISYNVLGGMIKGNARLEVSAGDKCYPYAAGGFNLDIIDQIYPDDSFTGDAAADPYTNPKVSFKMPVADWNRPWDAEIQIPVIEGNSSTVKTLAPVLQSYSLKRVRNNGVKDNIPGSIEFSNTRRSVRYLINSPLADSDQQVNNRNFELRIRLKVKEKINGSWSLMSDFDVDSIVPFQAGPLPPYIEYVTHTNPIKGQRYFMAQEWASTRDVNSGFPILMAENGRIKLRYNEKEQRFYATDNRGNDCHYDIVWKTASDGEEVHRHTIPRSRIYNKRVDFPIAPDLVPNTRYILQLIRRKTRGGLPILSGNIKTLSFNQINRNLSETYDVEAEYSIEYETDGVNTFEEVNDNETLLHMFVFKTSSYDNLEEKLASANLELIEKGTLVYNQNGYPMSLAQDNIKIADLDEAFEEAEIIGHTNVLTFPEGTSESFFTHPRVVMVEPFKGDFYDQQVKPKVNNLVSQIRLKIDGKDTGLRTTSLDISTNPIQGGLTPGSIQGMIPDGFGLGGPSIDFSSNYFVNNGNIFHINYGPYMQYMNSQLYNNGSSNMYGETTVKLSNIITSQSYLAQPIPQVSGTIDFISANFLLTPSGSGNSLSAATFSRDVMFTYNIRERVGQDIINLVNWTESKIDIIRFGNNLASQSWSTTQVNNYLSSTINAYNSLVNSSLYSGSNPPISTGGPQYYSVNYTNPPFIPSNIDFYYNTAHVDRANSELFRIGSKVVKTVTD